MASALWRSTESLTFSFANGEALSSLTSVQENKLSFSKESLELMQAVSATLNVRRVAWVTCMAQSYSAGTTPAMTHAAWSEALHPEIFRALLRKLQHCGASAVCWQVIPVP